MQIQVLAVLFQNSRGIQPVHIGELDNQAWIWRSIDCQVGQNKQTNQLLLPCNYRHPDPLSRPITELSDMPQPMRGRHR